MAVFLPVSEPLNPSKLDFVTEMALLADQYLIELAEDECEPV